ncbi:GntR family transcriptional regulator [Jejuia pallidilutea]|jgi:DNA-binding transcriptional regulator YhcF (GntR family)|uniref:Transcriptional regulator n=1 Tax=Jejuia pallidilutea TaxID=504487 RepID=A0A090WHJ2_9FLAO|nr:GntR family transcriptional regulator [Jejuia pallidilutea]GAL66957.1 transcriptional regulator GntR family [Jejuia pallidilutea]GAL70255.1 transcriptional regulator [Jejuia pallidilutea]GAL90357.1 transcriptional regulator [Jejuia pallidilutea]
MEFKSNRGIFLQIADSLCNQILEGKLLPHDRVPSVRDLAVELEVNRNTVMRSYAYLQDEGIFENKRGVGFFVSESAIQKINNKAKKDFFENELPFLLKKIELLKLNSKDLNQLLNKIKNND